MMFYTPPGFYEYKGDGNLYWYIRHVLIDLDDLDLEVVNPQIYAEDFHDNKDNKLVHFRFVRLLVRVTWEVASGEQCILVGSSFFSKLETCSFIFHRFAL